VSLRPTTRETELRLRELYWSSDEFKGKSVLDIGSNSGLLSIFALQLGAGRVIATDPVAKCVEALQKIKNLHNLKIDIHSHAFKDLDPAVFRADIVLFMEVLHWAVSQGESVQQVIYRLWQLTGETLYLEFPWSINEPSIRAQTQLTEADYSAEIILAELNRAFRDVEIVSFPHYFGLGGDSKRVLVKASHPRIEYVVTSGTNAVTVNSLGERSTNYVANLLTSDGMKVFKQLSRHSCFHRLPMTSAETLLGDISRAQPSCLIAPEAFEGKSLIEVGSSRFILIPQIDRRRISLSEFEGIPADKVLDAIINLRRDFKRVEISEFESLRTSELFVRKINISKFPERFVSSDTTGLEPQRLLGLVEIAKTEFFDRATELCHADLQEGNIIIDKDGRARVIDIDNITLGTAFTDAFCALAWAGVPSEIFRRVAHQLETEENRKLAPADIGIAVRFLLHWFEAIEQIDGPEMDQLAKRCKRGLRNLLALLPAL
jgi:SAM-dependent methyltransferase